MSTDKQTKKRYLNDAVEEVQDLIKLESKAASSERNAQNNYEISAKNKLKNKTCFYIKYLKGKELYQNLGLCTSLKTKENATNVKELLDTANSDLQSLKTKLATVSSTLKKIKDKTYVSKEIACNLVECCLEKDKHENEDKYKAICEIPELEEKLGSIKEKAEKAYTRSEISFVASVNTIGIQSFVSLDGLIETSDDLVEKTNLFNENVQSNTSMFDTKIEECIAFQTSQIAEIVDKEFSNKSANCEVKALCETWNKTLDSCDENSNKPEISINRIKAICKKFKEDLDGTDIPLDPKFKKKPNDSDIN